MNSTRSFPLLFVLFAASLPISLFAGQGSAGVPPVSPDANITGRAHIPHRIPDGTPPPPPPPKPVWRVAPADILSEKFHRQGGRNIIVREIKPIALPPPPAARPSVPAEITPELRQRIAEYREKHTRHQTICLGATIYRLENDKTRTHLHVWGNGENAPVSFWSSGDFSLLAGAGAFTDKHGETRALFMMHSLMDISRLKALSTTRNHAFTPPEIPDLSDATATFVISEGQADNELLAAIHALHEILNDPVQNRELHEAVRLREETRKNNPSIPKDILLHHWRIENP